MTIQSDPKKTVAVVLSGVLVAVTPSVLGYMQNRDEIRAKYAQSQINASAGYDALAGSVKELQLTTLAQHDYIVKMQAQFELMEKFVLSRTGGSGQTGAGRVRPQAAIDIESLPAPPLQPTFGKVPDDFTAATRR